MSKRTYRFSRPTNTNIPTLPRKQSAASLFLEWYSARPSLRIRPRIHPSRYLRSAAPLSSHASVSDRVCFAGAHHSIGSNITWALFSLHKHPECLAKLLREVDSVEDVFDFTSIHSKMPYLDAVIPEVNRLYPTVHSTVRVLNREITLASSRRDHQSIALKPSTLVYLSLRDINTSPAFWGADAQTFVPERFLGNSGRNEQKDTVRQPFMSYGYGPWSCVGLYFSYLFIFIACVGKSRVGESAHSLIRSGTNSPY